MTYTFPPDLQKLVEAQLASGRYVGEDDVLRDAMRALSDEHDDLDAVRAAISQWRAGDAGVPVDEAFALIRTTVESSRST